MSQKNSFLNLLKKYQVIAIIRTQQMELSRKIARATAAGGINLIEIPWNDDWAASLIEKLRSELPECTIGTGTLLNLDHVQQALVAGAQFLFSPKVDIELIKATAEQDIPFIPGALSPTEILAAWQAGASVVKVYPIQAVGGVSYIEILKGPLGHIPLIPTGGVTVENAKDFLAAGAIAVGLAGDLFPKAVVEAGDWGAITQRVCTLTKRLPTPAP